MYAQSPSQSQWNINLNYHLDRLEREARRPMQTADFRQYAEGGGAHSNFLAPDEARFVDDLTKSYGHEFGPRLGAGAEVVQYVRWDWVAVVCGITVGAAISIWPEYRDALLTISVVLCFLGGIVICCNIARARQFNGECSRWRSLSKPYEDAVKDRSADWKRGEERRAKAARKRAFEALYEGVVRKWGEGGPGLMTEHFARNPPHNGTTFMPIVELHAKFYELYGGHEMRNKLIWEGHYDSLVMDDLIAALGAGRGRHLFEFIEYKVDEDNLRRANRARLAEEEARRQEDRDEYERRRLDDRWDRRVEQGEREARAEKLGDEISGLHQGIAVAEQQGNSTYAAYLRGEIARLEAQSRGL